MKITNCILLTGLSLSAATAANAGIITKGEWGQADFYGSLRAMVSKEEGRGTNLQDGVSRIGVRGFVDFEDGWQGTFRLEERVFLDEGTFDADDSSGGLRDFARRVTYIGIKNKDFGEVRLGKQITPHYVYTILPIDITLHNPRHYNIRWNASENSSIREANSVSYWSPKFGGLQLAGLVELDGSDQESNGVDSYNVAARYKTGAFQFGASYLDRSDNKRINPTVTDDEATTFGLSFQYKTKTNKVALRYQFEDIDPVDPTKTDEFTTIGAYYAHTFGGSKPIQLQFRLYRLDNGEIDGFQSAVGVTRKFGKAGELFVDYVNYDDEAAILKGRQNDVSAGLKINF